MRYIPELNQIIDLLAIWGGLLSTFLGVMKILEYRKDRANIKVKISTSNYHDEYEQYPREEEYRLFINVVNKGRRPITIKEATLLRPNKKFFVVEKFRSRYEYNAFELTEGRSCSYCMDSWRDRPPPRPYVAYVVNAAGKRYWSHNFLVSLFRLKRHR